MKRLLPVLTFLLVGFCLTARAAKTVYIPYEWQHPWPSDSLLYAESDPQNRYTWSKSRSVETDNFIIFWDKYYGNTAPDKLASSDFFYFDLTYMKKKLEEFYELEINKLGFVDPQKSNVAKYKIMVLLNHTTTWTCYGGGYDFMVPALWLNPATSKPVGHSVAHEVGHSFHYMCFAEAAGHTDSQTIGTGFHLAVGNGQGIWEQTAQWQANQSYPSEMYNQSWSVFRRTHNYAYTHEWHRYQSYWMHYHLADKYGITTVADVWNTPMVKGVDFFTDACDFNQSLMKLKGWTPEDLYREYYEYAAKCVTQDWAACAPYRNAYIGNFNYAAVALGERSYQVAMASCPQSTGFNVIPLNVPEAGTTITANFTALRTTNAKLLEADPSECMNGETAWGKWTASTYNTRSNGAKDAKKGFRLGFVALLNNGERVYLHEDQVYCKGTGNQSDQIQAEVPEGTQRLWMVVVPAPTEYFQHLWDETLTVNDDFWPYQVSFEGTDINQNAASIYMAPTLDGRKIQDCTFTYDVYYPATTGGDHSGTSFAVSGQAAATLGTAFQLPVADIPDKIVTWNTSGPRQGQIMFYACKNADNYPVNTTSNNTANGLGHWFNATGNVSDYGSGYVYSEFTQGSLTFTLGQYPGRCKAGNTYTICQALRYSDPDQRRTYATARFVFRIHITTDQTAVQLSSIKYENTDAIQAVQPDTQASPTSYDLSGRRLNGQPRTAGIYIVDGKKKAIR